MMLIHRMCVLCFAATLRTGLAAMLLAIGLPVTAQVPVVAYNTYLEPPFVTAVGGLAQDVEDVLNKKLHGEYRIRLESLPRARLNRTIFENPDTLADMVLFLNPRFVDDTSQTRYLWSAPLFVTTMSTFFVGGELPDMGKPNPSQDLRFGAILENRYFGLDDLDKNGVITRENGPNELVNLRELVEKRIDFTQMNRSFLNAMTQTQMLSGKLVSMPDPNLPDGKAKHP